MIIRTKLKSPICQWGQLYYYMHMRFWWFLFHQGLLLLLESSFLSCHRVPIDPSYSCPMSRLRRSWWVLLCDILCILCASILACHQYLLYRSTRLVQNDDCSCIRIDLFVRFDSEINGVRPFEALTSGNRYRRTQDSNIVPKCTSSLIGEKRETLDSFVSR